MRAEAAEFPECCSLFSGEWHGTGVLVAPRIVLTAAHCLTPPVAAVAFAVAFVPPADESVIAQPVATGFHPAFTGDGSHDLGFVALESSPGVQAVSLASTAEIMAATEIILVGFGYDEAGARHVKRKIRVRIHFAAGGLEGSISSAVGAASFDRRTELLVGDPGRGASMGDSGGPAYVETAEGLKLAGIISRGPQCEPGGITIVERIDVESDWIARVIVGY